MDLDSIDFDLVDMVPGDAPLQQADHVPDNAGNPLVVELEEVPDVSPQMPEVPDVDLPPQFKRLKLLRSVILKLVLTKLSRCAVMVILTCILVQKCTLTDCTS